MHDKPKHEYPVAHSHKVYGWPEFKAFAQRLGIDWENKTLDLIIFLPVDGLVKVIQEYRGSDLQVPEPRAIDLEAYHRAITNQKG